MHGFLIQISLSNTHKPSQPQWKPLFGFQPEHVDHGMHEANVRVDRFTSKKYCDNKLWINNPDFMMVTDGLILNLGTLLTPYAAPSIESLIQTLSEKDSMFFRLFHGSFVGFFWNKKEGTYTAFNNQTGSRRLFMYRNAEALYFSTDLYTLSRCMPPAKRVPDTEAILLMLTSGFMHENITPLMHVRQIKAGKCVEWCKDGLIEKTYFDLAEIPTCADSETKAIGILDELFGAAVAEEFRFGQGYGFTPHSTLSGGLDSRMVVLKGLQLGFKNQVCINFCEPGYADEAIARRIAKTHQLPFISIPLRAQSLLPVDDVTAVNDGLTLYTNASQVFEAVKHLDGKEIGLIHTGTIGDGVMGSYLTAPEEIAAKPGTGGYSTMLLKKALPIIKKSIDCHKNEEQYKLYNRAFQGINNGLQYFYLIGEPVTPFTNPAFMTYATSLPASYKYKRRLYIRWILEKMPDAARFTWESTGGPPTLNPNVEKAYRLKRALLRRSPWPNMWKMGMTPEAHWYHSTPEVHKALDTYFEKGLREMNPDAALLADLKTLYWTGGINEKAQCLTVIATWKLLCGAAVDR